MDDNFTKIELYEYLQLISRVDKAEAKVSELSTQLKVAVELLHLCLDWDNGGERYYDKICDFLNGVD